MFAASFSSFNSDTFITYSDYHIRSLSDTLLLSWFTDTYQMSRGCTQTHISTVINFTKIPLKLSCSVTQTPPSCTMFTKIPISCYVRSPRHALVHTIDSQKYLSAVTWGHPDTPLFSRCSQKYLSAVTCEENILLDVLSSFIELTTMKETYENKRIQRQKTVGYNWLSTEYETWITYEW